MRYSIIVPIYKVESYIHKCLESLINQSFSDIEIILVDDGSPDCCPQICDDYARKDNRIKVIHKENGGLSDARNAGIEMAHGDYIMFVDSDDYIELDACEKILPFLKNNPDVVIGDGLSEGRNIDLSHISSEDVLNGSDYLKKAFKFGKVPMAAWLNIFRRQFLDDNKLRFKKGILHEDEQFTPRALLKANSIVLTNEVFYHYIVREDSITTKSDKRKNAIDFYNTVIELEKVYLTIPDSYLKRRLLDSLAAKYLSLCQAGKIYQYGRAFYHKDMVLRNAKRIKTKLKAYIYVLSPQLYWNLNKIAKGK